MQSVCEPKGCSTGLNIVQNVFFTKTGISLIKLVPLIEGGEGLDKAGKGLWGHVDVPSRLREVGLRWENRC